MSEIYADYDRFAWFYNRHWGEEFSRPALGIFEKILFPHLPTGASILDLCCGTGQLAAGLASRGYQVRGLDGSESMLRYARQNAPTVEFIRADARAFALPAVHDAVVSTFDSLNHILDLAELTAAFRCVRAALRPGGRFIFDLNMEEEFERNGYESSFDIIAEDHACVVRSHYDAETQMKRYEVKMYRRRGGEWEREELILLQRYYPAPDIVAALSAAGFVQVESLAAAREFALAISDGRSFFIAS